MYLSKHTWAFEREIQPQEMAQIPLWKYSSPEITKLFNSVTSNDFWLMIASDLSLKLCI